MARLVPFDISVGSKYRIREAVHTILAVKPGSPLLTLRRDGDRESEIQMTRAELATLVVKEEAELIDELEDPDCRPTREVTNLSLVPAVRVHDWFTIMFLLRQLVGAFGHSPRTAEFRTAFKRASEALDDYRKVSGVLGGNLYSAWAMYNLIRRWRANRFDIGVLQRRGFEYCPWKTRNPVIEEGKRFAREYLKEHPLAASADIHEEANKHLKAWSASRTAQASSSQSN